MTAQTVRRINIAADVTMCCDHLVKVKCSVTAHFIDACQQQQALLSLGAEFKMLNEHSATHWHTHTQPSKYWLQLLHDRL